MAEDLSIEALAKLMTQGAKDLPTRLECAPDVLAAMREKCEPEKPGVISGLLSVPVTVCQDMKPHEWKVFSGEKLLIHCFPNPFKEGEMIAMRPPDFTPPGGWQF